MSEPIGSIQHGEASRVSRLVAARVYGPARGGSGPAASAGEETAPSRSGPVGTSRSETGEPGALPFYANPASRVEAATAIEVGRVLDVKG